MRRTHNSEFGTLLRPTGAGWRNEAFEGVRGRVVAVWPDDEGGGRGAAGAARSALSVV